MGAAELKGWRLHFCGASRNWGGAVATVIEDAGSAVPGAVYLLSDENLASLDGYEGHPTDYVRSTLDVVVQGRVMPAWVYVKPVASGPCRRSARYVDALREGYAHFGLDVRVLEEALVRSALADGE